MSRECGLRISRFTKNAGSFVSPQSCGTDELYFVVGGVPLPETLGGQGVPGVGFIPPFACEFPAVEELELELDPEPVVDVVPLVVPGRVPHGALFGLPDVVEPFGFVVEGCVLLGVVGEPGVPALGVVLGVVGLG